MRPGGRAPRQRRSAARPATGGRPAAVDLSPRNQRRRGPQRARRRPASRGPLSPPGPPFAATVRALAARWARPGLRVLVLGLLLATGVLLLANPAFAARRVEVTGARHLGTAEVLRRTGLSQRRSLFLLTPETAEAALLRDPYVKSASIRTLLPDRVDVLVTEWEPSALVHRDGRGYLLNVEGTVLGPALAVTAGSGPGQPRVEVNWEAPGPLKTGERALAGRLIVDLRRIQEAFPSAYHLTVRAINLAADQQLVIETVEGPRILFGQMVTGEQLDSLDTKLASLKGVASQVDLAHSRLEYVNLMNPSQPVTRAIPSPSPSTSPTRK
ncbi:MAG: hypothetical protein NVSMB17_17330 [Candidatus Dormibacteria bacterium]